MIKQIGKFNIALSPLVVEKQRELDNNQNDDLLLLEPLSSSISIPDTSVSMDYIDYAIDSQLNRDCNIALEQQSNDTVIYEEGIINDGTFDPYVDEINVNGTYKKLVYSQINSAFYNLYRNPLQIFGLENIDFYLGKTERYLSDYFRVFTIPQIVFGDCLVKKTIRLFDNTLDDNVDIIDDGFCNLIAGTNLFSKIQEVRNLGNVIIDGVASCSGSPCPLPEAPTNLTTTNVPPDVLLEWIDNSTTENGFRIYRSSDSGSSWSLLTSVGANITQSIDTTVGIGNMYSYKVQAYNSCGTSSYSDTASIDLSLPITLSVSSGSAILLWNSSSNSQVSFDISKSLDGLEYVYYDRTFAPVVTYTDTNVTGGNTYWYQVVGVDESNRKIYSNTASITFDGIVEVLPPPTAYYSMDSFTPGGEIEDIISSSYLKNRNNAFTISSSGIIGNTGLQINNTLTGDTLLTSSSDIFRMNTLTEGFTMRFWFRLPTGSSPIQLVFIGSTSHYASSDMLLHVQSGTDLTFRMGYDIIHEATRLMPTDTEWHKILMTYESSSRLLTLQVDNGLYDNSTINVPDWWGDGILQIGTFSSAGMPLSIDEFGYWRDYIFTTDDRRIDWNNGLGTDKFRPATPINFTVQSGSAILSWATSSKDKEKFVIQKSTDGMVYNDYVLVNGSLTTYTDENVYYGNDYWYRIAAINQWATSSVSSPVNISFNPMTTTTTTTPTTTTTTTTPTTTTTTTTPPPGGVGLYYSGDTTGKPTWQRPTDNGPLPPDTLSGIGTAVPYESVSFTVDQTGQYKLWSTASGWVDNFAVLYVNSFDAGNGLTNVLIANDSQSTGYAGFEYTLTSGTTYIFVETGFDNTTYGTWELNVNGPGNVTQL